jgi:S-formylglutathione hydrolase FrmB
VGGFSQGGTCAIELGAGHPELFGHLIDVSGERDPSLGSVQKTIDGDFGGSWARYDAARPATELARHRPYRDEDAFFAAGQLDRFYGPVMPEMAALARQAGMHVTTWVVPRGVHNWGTGSQGIAAGLLWLLPGIGLTPR